MSIKNWQKFFKEEAPHYLENCFTKNTEFEIHFLINELGLKKGSLVLDLGCGVGRHSLGLARKGMQVTGIDLSHDMLRLAGQRAREEGLEITFIQGDASRLTVERQFDHVICICEGAFSLYEEGIEPFQYHRNILNNVYSMLKPGGKFFMTVLNGFKMIREHSDDDVRNGKFDPVTISTTSDVALSDGSTITVCEQGFLPHELMRMLDETGFSVMHLWGGTAGAWHRKPLMLDEYEIMAISKKQ